MARRVIHRQNMATRRHKQPASTRLAIITPPPATNQPAPPPSAVPLRVAVLTQVLAADDVGAEWHEQVVAGLAQLRHADGRRTAHHARLVVVEHGAEHGRADALGHVVLAALVGAHELEARGEHPAGGEREGSAGRVGRST